MTAEDALVARAWKLYEESVEQGDNHLIRCAIRAAQEANARYVGAIREWADAHGAMEQKTRGIAPGDDRLYKAEKELRRLLDDIARGG